MQLYHQLLEQYRACRWNERYYHCALQVRLALSQQCGSSVAFSDQEAIF